MALNWYTDKIAKRQGEERYHILTTHPLGRSGPRERWKWHPVTEALVGLSMNCGFYEVRETNALEIARRIATYERTRGAVLVTRSTRGSRPRRRISGAAGRAYRAACGSAGSSGSRAREVPCGQPFRGGCPCP